MDRDFKGVWIPKEVWLDNRLSALDKVILVEVDSLDQGERGCYASNEHLAQFCQCSKTKVSTAISKLVDLGYLYVQKYDGRSRELKSRLSKIERQTFKNCKADLQNLKESNIDSNTVTNTNKKENAPRHKFGEYANVLLTDEDFSKLKEEFPRDYQERIERLSEYIASSGKTYKNHLATIRNWARRDKANSNERKFVKEEINQPEWEAFE